jgi:hypothetical protein
MTLRIKLDCSNSVGADAACATFLQSLSILRLQLFFLTSAAYRRRPDRTDHGVNMCSCSLFDFAPQLTTHIDFHDTFNMLPLK